MANQGLMTAQDVKGAWAIMPTPAKDGADDWRAVDTVDLEESARVAEALIQAGIDGILTLGTLGECATLTLAEKRAYIGALVEPVRYRSCTIRLLYNNGIRLCIKPIAKDQSQRAPLVYDGETVKLTLAAFLKGSAAPRRS